MSEIDIVVAHSHIGASSMHRWSVCAGSVRLSRGITPKTSVYAEEGTRAHELAATIIQSQIIPADADPEMLEAVMVYVSEVAAAYAEAGSHGQLFIEQKFDLSKIHPGLFGTADAVVCDPKRSLLQVFDYKHGSGIAVEVEENEQLMYYGLGALLSTGFKCRDVELIIVQPRCDHPEGRIRRWKFESFALLDFAADLKKFAEKTEDPNAPLVPGEHCRFCPAAGICPAIHSKALTLAKEEFSPVFSYDPQKLSQVLEWLPALEGWIKNVREFAYAEAEHGRCPPGWKLVEKRATRKWRDESFAMHTAHENKKLGLIETCIKSVAKVETILGKQEFKELFGDQVTQESSGLTLVHESDKRPPKKVGAKSEFTKIETNTDDMFE
jgi:hypothetical protein